MVKTVTEAGKLYKVTYEDKGDGKGMKEVSKEFLGNINNRNLLFDQFNTNNIESEFFSKYKRKKNKQSRRKNQRNNLRNNSRKRKRNMRQNYKTKTIFKKIKGEGYLVTYESVNNEKFREIRREKI